MLPLYRNVYQIFLIKRPCYQRAVKESNHSNDLVKDCARLQPYEREKRMELLKEARECCGRALSDCNNILHDIATQNKKKRQKTWRVDLKFSCKSVKESLEGKLLQIEAEIQRIEGTFAFDQAAKIYQKAIQRAAEAASLELTCERDLLQSDEVIATLEAISKLYGEAIDLSQDALSHLLTYPSQKENQDILKNLLQTYQELERHSKEEIANWPNFVQEKKAAIKERIKTLKEDGQLFLEKGLRRACYDLQKLVLPLFETLLQVSEPKEKENFEKELIELKSAILAFENEADAKRLIPELLLLSQEEFEKQDQKRKEVFFKSEFFLNPNVFLLDPLVSGCLPRVVPLDGQMRKKEKIFSLYTNQFYRFLIETNSEMPEISIIVYEEETISLPFKNFRGLENYLREGMVFSPDTPLKSQFGLDLRFSFFYTPKKQFSMIVSQKIIDLRYRISFSLGENASTLYECDFLLPPPWQLGVLRKPGMIRPNQRISPSHSIPTAVPEKENIQIFANIETKRFKVLDQLVEDLNANKMAMSITAPLCRTFR